MISVVIPVYNNELTIVELLVQVFKQLKSNCEKFEVICVDDASTDNSLLLLKNLALEYSNLKIISLQKNSGQHPAIFRGLQKAKGEWIVIMDADGQDNPATLPLFIQHTSTEVDAVFALREKRNSSLVQRLTSFLFYKLWQLLGNERANYKASNFGIYRRNLIEAVIQSGFPPFSLQLIAIKLKAPRTYVIGQHNASKSSSYNLFSRWRLSSKILFLYSFKSLRRLLFAGIIFILIANSILVRYLLNGRHTLKWPWLDTVLISTFMCFGAILLFIFFSAYSNKKSNLKINH